MNFARIVVFVLAAVSLSAGDIQYDTATQIWTLRSGSVEYDLARQDNSVYLDYFGPAGKRPSKPAQPRDSVLFDFSGVVDGRNIVPEELELKSSKIGAQAPGAQQLQLVYKHRRLPLEIEARYSAWGDTGVFTRELNVTNTGTSVLHIESLPSLSLRLPPGDYDLSYLWGGWGQEMQLVTEHLSVGRRAFVSDRGRSTSQYAPWFMLRNNTLGVRYAAQLAWSGNWDMSFERRRSPDIPLDAKLGMMFDYGGALAVLPGASRVLPEVAFTASAGDLDDAANQLHRYQRRYVFARTPANDPLLVQFNSWYPFPGKMTVAEMKRSAEVAADLGTEVFVLDAGWYSQKDWDAELGDYQVDPTAFPNGLQELSEYVRSRGMKFGLWVEIENVGVESNTFRQHPDWCLQYDGKPIRRGKRYQLNFAKPEVRRWARAVVDRLVRDYHLEWIKIDYNLDIGSQFDPASFERPGDVLQNHLLHYYAWLDELRAAWPRLVIENCSSGGLRFDLGILRHTHTNWISDVVKPLPSVQLAYGCTVEFAPEVCNHWMVGDRGMEGGSVDFSKPAGWWDFMLRVPMNGQYGISSRVFQWIPELRKHARDNIALYKRVRPVIAGADVYHLTPPPDHNEPTGWMALQYALPDRSRSVLMAYRLKNSEQRQVFRLRGLAAGGKYRVSVDGTPLRTMDQRELSGEGLAVELDAEWRAAVIELEIVP